ncbi:MAG: hypothetical protein S0880_05895 [Actinomycetota bacterium]|nr:hypothetical protein [Actinomycetota bacterium]
MNHVAVGDPGGLEPIVPTVAPLRSPDGTPMPYLASNTMTAFSVLDTGAGEVVSYRADLSVPDPEVIVFDRFPLGRP